MKTLAWNCRGMFSTTAVRELVDLHERVKADVIFLSESHLNKARAEQVCGKLGLDRFHIFESDGRSGGLVLFYNLANEVVLNFTSANYIDCFIMENNLVAWRLTGFY